MLNYWLGIFIADIVKYIIFIIIIYPALLTTSLKFLYMLILFGAFILSSSLFTYAFSYIFTDEKDGQKLYLLFVYLVTLLLIFAQFILFQKSFISSNYSFGLTEILPCSNLFYGVLKFWMLDSKLDHEGSFKSLGNIILINIITD